MNDRTAAKATGPKPHLSASRPGRASPRDPTNTATDDQHMNDEVKRPTKPRADLMPKEGFVLTIDGKMKAAYETEPEATAAAVKLKERFPVIQVSVYDAAAQTYTLITVPAS